MFETVALYDNQDLLLKEPVGRMIQILVFDGSKALDKKTAGKNKKNNATAVSAAEGSVASTGTGRMWMLEFSDDIEAEIQINIVKVPQDPTVPCLRVGQSMCALIPPLHTTQYKDEDEGDDTNNHGNDDSSGGSGAPRTTGSDNSEANTSVPLSPRIYMFGKCKTQRMTRATTELIFNFFENFFIWHSLLYRIQSTH